MKRPLEVHLPPNIDKVIESVLTASGVAIEKVRVEVRRTRINLIRIMKLEKVAHIREATHITVETIMRAYRANCIELQAQARFAV